MRCFSELTKMLKPVHHNVTASSLNTTKEILLQRSRTESWQALLLKLLQSYFCPLFLLQNSSERKNANKIGRLEISRLPSKLVLYLTKRKEVCHPTSKSSPLVWEFLNQLCTSQLCAFYWHVLLIWNVYWTSCFYNSVQFFSRCTSVALVFYPPLNLVFFFNEIFVCSLLWRVLETLVTYSTSRRCKRGKALVYCLRTSVQREVIRWTPIIQ